MFPGKKTIFGVLLFGTQAVFAALPPLAQSEREIQAILTSQEGYRLLGGADPIEQISRVEKGYLISTRHKELKVDINYVKTDRIGPQEFTLFFHPPVDLD
jgi:hypothetical protein